MKFSRRQMFSGLLAAGPAWPAPARASNASLQVGLALPAGTGSAAWARRWVLRLAQAWQAPVASVVLPAGDDALAWCHAPSAAERLLVAGAWLPAAAAWPFVDSAAARPMSMLAVLARQPLVLVADRAAPASWASAREAALSAPAPWRCAMDADTAAVSQHLLQSLGLGSLQPLAFRGPAQLLAAVAGARVPLAVCTACQRVGQAWQDLPLDALPGQMDDVAAAHRQGDVHVLAVAHASRLPALPGVPTVDELLGRSGNDIGRCLLLLAPAGRAADLGRRLRAALDAA